MRPRDGMRAMLRSAAVVSTGTVLFACASSPALPSSDAPGVAASARAAIVAALDTTAAGWNRGDLNAYLSAYTPEATEMLSTGPAGGVDAIERTMRQGFWKNGRPAQQLAYDHLEVRMLGRDHALVTGQYILSGGDLPQRSGWFTTIWSRTPAGWKMIHDHS